MTRTSYPIIKWCCAVGGEMQVLASWNLLPLWSHNIIVAGSLPPEHLKHGDASDDEQKCCFCLVMEGRSLKSQKRMFPHGGGSMMVCGLSHHEMRKEDWVDFLRKSTSLGQDYHWLIQNNDPKCYKGPGVTLSEATSQSYWELIPSVKSLNLAEWRFAFVFLEPY